MFRYLGKSSIVTPSIIRSIFFSNYNISDNSRLLQ